MTLKVFAFGAYPSYDYRTTPWRNEDHQVHNLVMVVKREAISGYSWVQRPSGATHKLKGGDENIVLEIFGHWGARLIATSIPGDVHLVPIPSSKQVHFGADTTTARMAQAVAQRSGGRISVRPILRFRAPLTPARQGGPRDVATLRASLECSEHSLTGRFILVDDVATSGGHMKAAAQFLRGLGATVEEAIVLGRTVQEQVRDPLNIAPFDLEAVAPWPTRDDDLPF